MVVTNSFIFLRIEKTGSIFLKDFFLQNINGAKELRKDIGKFGNSGHFGLNRKPTPRQKGDGSLEQLQPPIVFCGIRNPYSWWVSFYNMAKADPKHNAEYDVSSFEHFINHVWESEGRGLYFNYEFLNHHKIGLLTHQWLKIACAGSQIPYDLDIEAKPVVDHVYRQEHLVDDILSFINFPLELEQKLKSAQPTNVGKKEDWHNVITEPIKQQIRFRERMIFDLFKEYDV